MAETWATAGLLQVVLQGSHALTCNRQHACIDAHLQPDPAAWVRYKRLSALDLSGDSG